MSHNCRASELGSLKISIGFFLESRNPDGNSLTSTGMRIVHYYVGFLSAYFSRNMRIGHLLLLLPICVENRADGKDALDV